MKLSNLQVVNYINCVNEMKEKKLPVRMSFALRSNFNLFGDQVKAYEEARKECLECTDEQKRVNGIRELLAEEVEQNVKMITLKDLEIIDENDAYDKLTIAELEAIAFMIEEAE